LIGQSKKDDYGRIHIQSENPQPYQPTITNSDNRLTLWILSDLLLRDKRLHPTPDLETLKTTIENTLGVKLEEINQMVRQRRTESWQVRWGLPRPSLAGIQAGSCLIYEVIKGSLDINRLTQIQAQGIGERIAEGYGQISFNDVLLTTQLSSLSPPSKNQDDTTPENSPFLINSEDSSFKYARIIEKEAWREAIQEKALSLAASRDNRLRFLGIEIKEDKSYPPMTQLGALRSVSSKLQELKTDNSNPVIHWLNQLEKVNNRKEKWKNNSLTRIRNLVTEQEKIWEILQIPDNLTITATGTQEIKQKLWAQAIRTLIDACIRAHKRDLESQQGN